MRLKPLLLLMAAAALIVQSCKKTDSLPQANATDHPIESSTGLTLNAVGDQNYYQFINSTGNWAEVANSSTTVGGTYKLSAYTGTTFQKWEVTRVSNADYTISNLENGLYAQSYNYNGTRVVVQNKKTADAEQLWKISLVSGKSYKVINKADGLALTGSGTGMIQLKPYTGLASQLWGFNELPASDTVKANSFTVTNAFQNNMVIQRDKPFKVWGTASANAVVSVKASWNGAVVSTITDGAGKWQLAIPAAGANAAPQTLVASVTGKPSVTFSNLLIGDVWICSGQSNMVMPVDSVSPFFGFEGVINYKAEIAAANYPQIRALTVGYSLTPNLRNDVSGKNPWIVCSPTKASAGSISAVSYYFARKLNTSLNIPIGIVISAASGTFAEEWVSKETLQNDPKLAVYNNLNKNSATQLYNGMIYPLRNLSIKGFIWYQGENNRADLPPSNYTNLNSALIKNWRELFNQGQLPFYYVQMTPLAARFFATDPWGDNPVANDYAFFREAQANIRAVPGTGMAIALDCGELIKIHPRIKKPIGERLALLALKNDYKQNVTCIGPQYQSFTQSGSVATVNFKAGTSEGLKRSNNIALGQYF
ncbi:MAG: sialate O-acetylesterase, partial [Mucilaginibacter sp.]